MQPIERLLAGAVRSIIIYPDGAHAVDQPSSGAVLSGSFNPLHAGHIQLATVAAATVSLPALFELPVVNADKGQLTAAEIARRVAQFRGQHTVVLSREPLFREKAALFPNSVFVVGYDTAVRLVAPRYYGGETAMHQALTAIRDAGCRFLVGGRTQDEQFYTLADVQIPPPFAAMFLALPEDAFRIDISSTELRAQTRQQD